jgi:hypothetical protein
MGVEYLLSVRHFLKVQADGNLVIYTRSLRPIWESGTGGTP